MKHFQNIKNSILGNLLEWYDFGLFTLFSPVFSQLFFPDEAPLARYMATFSIFAIGFFFRPVGALLFGYMGDRLGRAKTLRYSIILISIPTLLITFIPTYKQIGILAPVLLTLVRILQGISVGGEYAGNFIYLAESAPEKYRATFASFASASSNLGILLAALTNLFLTTQLTDTQFLTWGWRIPYFVSGFLCLYLFLFRLTLTDTKIFIDYRKTHHVVSNPIYVLFSTNIWALLKTIGLVCMGTSFYYFCFVYIPMTLLIAGKPIENISFIMSIFVFIMIVCTPIAGLICDRFGRKQMMLFNSVMIMLCIIPGFYFLHSDHLIFILLTVFVFTLLSSLEQGTTPVTLVETFPLSTRYSGIALGYNISNGILGGTLPIICNVLISITTLAYAPTLYVFCFAFITFLVAKYTLKYNK